MTGFLHLDMMYANPFIRHILTKGIEMAKAIPGLIKLAQIPTVGDVMNRINADLTLNSFTKRTILDEIRSSGLDVKQPGSRLASIGIGALAGNMLGKYLGANPFWKGVSTLGGALYGNSQYNKSLPEHPWGSGIHRSW